MKKKIPFLVMVWLTALVLLGCSSSENPKNPETSPTDTVINIAVIPGVTVPTTGVTPVTTISDNAQYTGTITWSPAVSNMFVSNTTYTATITLSAKSGYTLTGVTADFFTVAGSTSDTNAVNSCVVTVVFPTTTANLAAVTDYTGTGVGTLKAVNGGTFDVGPANMTVSSFRMSQYEVTRAQFLAVMGTDPSNTTISSGTNDPVQRVSLYLAIAFCNKLSLAEGLTPVYSVSGITDWTNLAYASIPTVNNPEWNTAVVNWSANGYRLPTEMEWMWAAMGAPADGQGGGINTTGINKEYAGSTEGWGNAKNIGNYAWYLTNSGKCTHPVGTKTVNEIGLYDMSGNVAEWCWDRYAEYPDSAKSDYRGASSGTDRIIHGGCLYSDSDYYYYACSIDYRLSCSTYQTGGDLGFRVVRP